MARIIFHAHDSGKWLKGDPVDAFANGTNLGSRIIPPNWGVVDIPATIAQVVPYISGWPLELDYTQVWSAAKQGYRVTTFSLFPATSGKGALTQAKIQNWLDRWDCEFQSASTNQVVFDIGIYESAISQAYWEKDVVDIVFQKIHFIDNVCRIEADYDSAGYGQTPIEKIVERKSDEIISHDGVNRVITFDISRTRLIQEFKKDVADTLHRGVSDVFRRYYFDLDFVDMIMNDHDGVFATTTQNVLANLIDRADG